MQKHSDGRLIITPPRLNGLRIKQQSLRHFTEQYVELYTWEHSLSCRAALLSSCRTGWLLSCLSSLCTLVLSSRRHLILAPHSSSSSCCTAPSHYPLVAPPSHSLIAHVGCCCVTSHFVAVLSSCHTILRHLVVALPLVALLSHPLVVLLLRHPLVV